MKMVDATKEQNVGQDAAKNGKGVVASGPQRASVAFGSALAALSGDLEPLPSMISSLAPSFSNLQKPAGGLSVFPSPVAAAEAAKTDEQAQGGTRHL